jgi:disulfide oxidoreductase YuzD
MFQALFLIVFLIFGAFSAGETLAQTSGAPQKTQEIVAALAKTKYKHKVKKNFDFELYIDIKNEPVVKNAAEYAGVYESEDAGYRIELRASGGKVEGSGYETNFETSSRVNFTLSDARIEGALLTANRVYADGSTKRLEAVFVNRTVTTGTNPNKISSRETKFGLGFVEVFNENSQSRIFCEYKP